MRGRGQIAWDPAGSDGRWIAGCEKMEREGREGVPGVPIPSSPRTPCILGTHMLPAPLHTLPGRKLSLVCQNTTALLLHHWLTASSYLPPATGQVRAPAPKHPQMWSR